MAIETTIGGLTQEVTTATTADLLEVEQAGQTKKMQLPRIVDILGTAAQADVGTAADELTTNDRVQALIAAVEGTLIGEYKYLNIDDPDYGIVLPDGLVRCDGQLISDPESVKDGKRIENLNGADVTLTLTWTADSGGAFATVPAADLPALAVGDWVTGSGIAADTLISDITGTTVTITDVSASGSISTTFNNDGLYISGGLASGVSLGDQMQRITGGQLTLNFTSFTGGTYTIGALTSVQGGGANINGSASGVYRQLSFDSANAPDARTSSTTAGRTRPHTMQMVVVTRIK